METGIIPEAWGGTMFAGGRNEGSSHGNRVVGPGRVTTVLGPRSEASSQGWGSDSGRKSLILMYHMGASHKFSCGSIVMRGVGIYRAVFEVLQYKTS